MAGDAKANINENIKKANIDYLKSTTFIKYYLPFFKLGLNADELHTLNLIFSFEANNKIYIGSSKYLCDMVMYSHHFRYRLEVGASCSIQLLL